MVMALLALLIGRRVIPFCHERHQGVDSAPAHTFRPSPARAGRPGHCFSPVGVATPWLRTGIDRCCQSGKSSAGNPCLGPTLVVICTSVMPVCRPAVGGGTGGRVWRCKRVACARERHGGFSVLIIGMVTRTALGPVGRPLATDSSMVASYALVLLAVVFRLVAIAPLAISALLLQLSAAAWIMAMALYLWRFAPLMIRPRFK